MDCGWIFRGSSVDEAFDPMCSIMTLNLYYSGDQLQTKIDETFGMIASIAELKLMSEENEEDVNDWTVQEETTMEVFEEKLGDFEEYFNDERSKAEKFEKAKADAATAERKKQELQMEEEIFAKRKMLELELE